ncbi:hypothetical protein [Ornithinimicrobium murale]|uniref:hypothetical protein n=1 Tax=Ornithinimicrobium murale TaxID=1050153 RepID=UPI000E0CE546|nr:hypothetical protein [Ornithinimicrobium murale]
MTGLELGLLIVCGYLLGAVVILAWHARLSPPDVATLALWPVLIPVAAVLRVVAGLRRTPSPPSGPVFTSGAQLAAHLDTERKDS